MSKHDNSKQSAVALTYNPQAHASPIIVAAGYGHIAEKIIEIADENNVPVFRDNNAISLLSMLEVGSSVPPELYQVIASIYISILKIADNESPLKEHFKD